MIEHIILGQVQEIRQKHLPRGPQIFAQPFFLTGKEWKQLNDDFKKIKLI